jgi:hypothetical protein
MGSYKSTSYFRPRLWDAHDFCPSVSQISCAPSALLDVLFVSWATEKWVQLIFHLSTECSVYIIVMSLVTDEAKRGIGIDLLG